MLLYTLLATSPESLTVVSFIENYGSTGVFFAVFIWLGRYFLKHAERLQNEVLTTKNEVITMQKEIISKNTEIMTRYSESNNRLFDIVRERGEIDRSILDVNRTTLEVNRAILETLEENHSECPNRL